MEAEAFTHWVRVTILSKFLILKVIQAILRVELTDSGTFIRIPHYTNGVLFGSSHWS